MRAIISGYGCCTRYTISADYVSNGWTFRTEYIHSTGRAGDNGVTINSFFPEHPLYRADLPSQITAVGSFF